MLHIITRYQRIKQQSLRDTVPRTFIFGGKSSPGNSITNLIIKLISSVAEVVNGDPDVAGKIMVVFLPDFNIRTAQSVYPAADLSEQISITGRDVPGSSSLKFALNGALTIGTPGGMNTEISEKVGIENFFLFGMDAEEVRQRKDKGYNPMELYRGDKELKEVIDLINSGFFSKNDLPLFKPLVDSLLRRDEYMILADYRSYVECQERAGMAFSEREKWTKMSVRTVARMGRFSSDRVVREYNEQIWHASPLKAEPEKT
jgi:starch phosphorylase